MSERDWTTAEGMAELERLHALVGGDSDFNFWNACGWAVPQLIAALRNRNAEIGQLQANLGACEKELVNIAAERMEQRRTEQKMQAECERLRKELKGSLSGIALLQEGHRTYEAELAALTAKHDALVTEHIACEAHLELANNALDILRTEHDALLARVAGAKLMYQDKFNKSVHDVGWSDEAGKRSVLRKFDPVLILRAEDKTT